jgi:hypothetical protein
MVDMVEEVNAGNSVHVMLVQLFSWNDEMRE